MVLAAAAVAAISCKQTAAPYIDITVPGMLANALLLLLTLFILVVVVLQLYCRTAVVMAACRRAAGEP
jgi:hypothetical protein